MFDSLGGVRYSLFLADVHRVVEAEVGRLAAEGYSCELEMDREGKDQIAIFYRDREGDKLDLTEHTYPSFRQGERKSNKVEVVMAVRQTAAARRKYFSSEALGMAILLKRFSNNGPLELLSTRNRRSRTLQVFSLITKEMCHHQHLTPAQARLQGPQPFREGSGRTSSNNKGKTGGGQKRREWNPKHVRHSKDGGGARAHLQARGLGVLLQTASHY